MQFARLTCTVRGTYGWIAGSQTWDLPGRLPAACSPVKTSPSPPWRSPGWAWWRAARRRARQSCCATGASRSSLDNKTKLKKMFLKLLPQVWEPTGLQFKLHGIAFPARNAGSYSQYQCRCPGSRWRGARGWRTWCTPSRAASCPWCPAPWNPPRRRASSPRRPPRSSPRRGWRRPRRRFSSSLGRGWLLRACSAAWSSRLSKNLWWNMQTNSLDFRRALHWRMKRGSRLEEIFAYLRGEKAVDRPTSAIFDLHLIFLLLCLFGYKFSFLGILWRFLREGANCRAELSNGFCCWSKSGRREI